VLVMIDLDNTLGNRTEAVALWVSEFVSSWKLPDEATGWIQKLDNDGYSARVDVFAAIQERYQIAAPVEELLAAYQDRVIELARPTEGAMRCLASLRGLGHTIAIVTNGSTKQQHGKIDAMGLRSLVDAVIVSGDLGIKKPDARIFEAAAAATGQRLLGSWMVGDAATNDVIGGHAVGAKTAWLHRDRTWTDPTCEPTVILNSLSELCDAIAEHG